MYPPSLFSGRSFIFSSVLLSLVIFQNDACFIRNCPPGGKRSMEILQRGVRECMSCGPGSKGQCVGTDICCGPFGCLIGTKESEICLKENDNRTPCSVNGEPCGVRNQGNCVAEGVCCDTDTCSLNSKCKVNSDRSNSEILSLINRLLENREYSD